MECNLYDFDGTIYDGDSAIDFYKYCLKKKPKIIRYLPIFIWYIILYFLDCTTKEKLKEKFYLYLRDFDNIDSEIKEFWKNHEKNIKYFYDQIKTENDIVISASPEFVLEPICKKLGIKKLIASKVDKKTGVYLGKNCYGEEKVVQFKEQCENLYPINVYSDSFSDRPLLKLGKRSYLVKGNELIELTRNDIETGHNKSLLKKISKFLFVISVPFMTTLICGNYATEYFKLIVPLSFICGLIIYFKILVKRDKKINYLFLFLAIIFGIYGLSLISKYGSPMTDYLIKVIYINIHIQCTYNFLVFLMCILALPAFAYIFYLLLDISVPFIRKECKELTKIEKLVVLAVLVISIIGVSIIYNKTNVFYSPKNKEIAPMYDVLYTTDTGYLTKFNCYLNAGCLENDIRQPLFGVYAMPFAIVSSFVSQFLFFIPNAYFIVFAVVQIMLLVMSFIMIAKMLKLQEKHEIFLLLMFLVSFPYLIFSIIYEQYIICTFYLILTIYMNIKYEKETNYSYIGAAGTLLTSGITFPLISANKDIRKVVSSIFKCFIWFIIVMILSGQILMIFKMFDRLNDLLGNYAGIPFYSKFCQFTNFVENIFLAPKSLIIIENLTPHIETFSTSSISFIGIIVLVLCFISFLLNKDNKLTRISFLWIVFSFILLCVIGWGTSEHGLVLYTLYFFWAYIVLIYQLINKIPNDILKGIIFALILIVMLYFNFVELSKIVNFGIKYYPVK